MRMSSRCKSESGLTLVSVLLAIIFLVLAVSLGLAVSPYFWLLIILVVILLLAG